MSMNSDLVQTTHEISQHIVDIQSKIDKNLNVDYSNANLTFNTLKGNDNDNDEHIVSITSTGDKLYAVTAHNILKSVDGIEWKAVENSPVLEDGYEYAKIHFENDTFIMVVTNLTLGCSKVITSTNMNEYKKSSEISGDILTPNGVYPDAIHQHGIVCHYDDVVIPFDNSIRYINLEDLVDYTSSYIIQSGTCVCANGNIIAGLYTNHPNLIYTSTVYGEWDFTTVGDNPITAMCTGNGYVIVCNTANEIFISHDNINWELSYTIPDDTPVIDMISCNDFFLAMTQSGSIYMGYEIGGEIVWKKQRDGDSTCTMRNISYANGIVACVGNNGKHSILLSTANLSTCDNKLKNMVANTLDLLSTTTSREVELNGDYIDSTGNILTGTFDALNSASTCKYDCKYNPQIVEQIGRYFWGASHKSNGYLYVFRDHISNINNPDKIASILVTNARMTTIKVIDNKLYVNMNDGTAYIIDEYGEYSNTTYTMENDTLVYDDGNAIKEFNGRMRLVNIDTPEFDDIVSDKLIQTVEYHNDGYRLITRQTDYSLPITMNIFGIDDKPTTGYHLSKVADQLFLYIEGNDNAIRMGLPNLDTSVSTQYVEIDKFVLAGQSLSVDLPYTPEYVMVQVYDSDVTGIVIISRDGNTGFYSFTDIDGNHYDSFSEPDSNTSCGYIFENGFKLTIPDKVMNYDYTEIPYYYYACGYGRKE